MDFLPTVLSAKLNNIRKVLCGSNRAVRSNNSEITGINQKKKAIWCAKQWLNFNNPSKKGKIWKGNMKEQSSKYRGDWSSEKGLGVWGNFGQSAPLLKHLGGEMPGLIIPCFLQET